MTTRRVIIDHADINVPDLAEARQFYRAALAPLGREELADPHGGMSCGVEGLDHFGIYGDSEDRHHAHVAFEAPTRKLERDGQVLGTVRCSGGRTAVDVMVVWGLVDGGTVTAQADRVNPDRPGDPAGGDPALTVDLHLAAVSEAAAMLRWVWLEYADDTGTCRWQDSWQPMDAGGGRFASSGPTRG